MSSGCTHNDSSSCAEWRGHTPPPQIPPAPTEPLIYTPVSAKHPPPRPLFPIPVFISPPVPSPHDYVLLLGFLSVCPRRAQPDFKVCSTGHGCEFIVSAQTLGVHLSALMTTHVKGLYAVLIKLYSSSPLFVLSSCP
ncbi:unnamed protein product [Pleuronectes platessa]|uniref:Uncharacterized protein n=1 Tax=Pleuronectes platessa TaxID=8262 RepID=A0A9N7UFH5_PLEPL|nr:unnamed protein product [Pleuronectes platessa]